MLLLRSPAENTDTGSRSEPVHVDAACDIPSAFARMIVQVPSEYTSAAHGTVSVTWNVHTRGYELDVNKDEAFQYVFGYHGTTMHIHPPSCGCVGFLVYDVACMGNTCTPELHSNHVAAGVLDECVKAWEHDKSFRKLAVVLADSCHRMDYADGFHFDKIRNVQDRAVINALSDCKALEVAFAGIDFVCVYACSFVYIRVI